jgi:anti-anti-sigma factor
MNPTSTSAAGQVSYAVIEPRAFLKLSGVLRHPLSKRLNLAVAKLFARPGIRSVVVDLQEAEFIDSTCLGLLAKVATTCQERGLDWPVLVSTHREINRLLCSMGFDRVFVLVENPEEPTAGWQSAEALAGVANRPDPQLVLVAHRALCEINAQNRHLFQNVIDQLELEVSGLGGNSLPQQPRPLL